MRFLFILLLFSFVFKCRGQFNFNQKVGGILLKPGVSAGNSDAASSRNSIFPTFAAGVYRYFSLSNRGVFPIHYVRTELNYGVHAGEFLLAGTNQTAWIKSKYLEGAVLIPFSWEVNSAIASNFGVGISASYISKQSAEVNGTVDVTQGNRVNGGFMIDYHMLFAGSCPATFGTRLQVSLRSYRYTDLVVYFGFALPKIKRQKAKSKP